MSAVIHGYYILFLLLSVATEVLPIPSDICESASGMLVKVGSAPRSILLEVPNHSGNCCTFVLE